MAGDWQSAAKLQVGNSCVVLHHPPCAAARIFGDRIIIWSYSKLLETHEDCRLSKHEDTRFIYDFDPLEQLLTKGMWESDAVADICVHDRALAAS